MVKALQKEILMRASEFENTSIQTIYFGGGTPSTLNIIELKEILNTVYKHYIVEENSENTIEVNPDDFFINGVFKKNVLYELKDIGFNRLSIGVQSFFDEDLTLMNRSHSSNQAQHLINEAKKVFDNITIDLIYGIPTLSNEKWKVNVQKAIELQVPHISAYALTVESRTALEKKIALGTIPAVDEKQCQKQFYYLIDTLSSHHFVHYELSNFGKEGYFSKNNTAYWSGKKYIGIGPSAHSYNGKVRSWNISNNILYINNIENNARPHTSEVLSLKDRFNELIITGLRTQKGVFLPDVKMYFGDVFYNYLLKQSESFIEKELLKINHQRLQTAYKGWFLLDGICSDLLWVD